MTQRKIDMLVERLNQLQLDVERRFGQLRSGLLLISLIVLVSIGQDSVIGQILLPIVSSK
ncbi:MAG: hypothetical protein ACON4F_00480 [Candidatus Puniceispirillaceae bacterium]